MASGNVNRRINLFINGKEVKSNAKSIQAEMRKLRAEINLLTMGTKEYNDKVSQLNQLDKIMQNHRTRLKGINKVWVDFKTIFLGTLGSNLAAGFFQRLTSQIPQSIRGLARISDELADIRKVTNADEEAVRALNAEFAQLDTRTSNSDLRAIAVEGGRLNIPINELKEFVQFSDQVGVSLGDDFAGGARAASATMGKMLTLFKETRDIDIATALNRGGSAINELGAKTKASAEPIAEYTSRMGQYNDAIKPTIQNTLGLGAAFDESGISAEISSRAYGILLDNATQNLPMFAEVMGMGVNELERLINTAPEEFLLQFAESLNQFDGNAVGLTQTLNSLGVGATGVQKILGAAGNNAERFREIMLLSNQAYADANSLIDEFNIKNENKAAQIEKSRKAFKRFVKGTGYREFLGNVISLGQDFSMWLDRNKQGIYNFGSALLSVVKVYAIWRISAIASNKISAIATKNFLKQVKAAWSLNRSYLGLSRTQTVLTIGANGLKNAFNVLWRTIKQNPFGTLLTVGYAVYEIFQLLGKSTKELTRLKKALTDIDKSYTERLAEQRVEAENQVNQILALNESSKERARLIDDINNRFGKIIDSTKTNNQLEKESVVIKDKINTQLKRQAEAEQLLEKVKTSAAAKDTADEDIKRLKERNKVLNALLKSSNTVVGTTFLTNHLGYSKEILENEQKIKDLISTKNEAIKEGAKAQELLNEKIKANPNLFASKVGNGLNGIGEIQKEVEDFDAALRALRGQYFDTITSLEQNAVDEYLNRYAVAMREVTRNMDELKKVQTDGELELLNIIQESIDAGLITEEEGAKRRKELHQETNNKINEIEKVGYNLRHEIALAAAKDIKEILSQEVDAMGDRLFEAIPEGIEKARLAIVRKYDKLRAELKSQEDAALEIAISAKLSQAEIDDIKQKFKEFYEELGVLQEGELNGLEEDVLTRIELLDDWIDQNRQFADTLIDIWSNANQIISNLEQKRFNSFVIAQNRQREILKAQKEAGLKTEKEYQLGVKKLDDQQEIRKREMAFRQHRRQQALAVSQATVNGAAAFVKTLAEPLLPFPANTIMAALIAANAAAQIGVILSQPAPKFEKGGQLVGKRHSEGGIKLQNAETGQIIGEAEDGENWFILSRKASENNQPAIQALLESSQTNGENILDRFRNQSPQINFQRVAAAERFSAGAVISSNSQDINVEAKAPDISELTQLFSVFINRLEEKEQQPIVAKTILNISELHEAEAKLNLAESLSKVAS